MSTTDVPVALSIRDVIKVTSIGRSTIYKLIGERRLVARKIGGRTLILKSDLDTFLRNLPELRERN